MKLAFIGPDMTGKSNIAEALSSMLEVPVFKNEGEWKTKLSGGDYFVNLLRYGGPFLMDFMKQTDSRVILDRFYPCELVYAEAFNRQTDNEVISWMDNEFSKLGGKFIICLKKDYSGLVDDVFPDQLPKEKLEELDALYRKFEKFTNCECLILETDDHDLARQTNEIMKFLGV